MPQNVIMNLQRSITLDTFGQKESRTLRRGAIYRELVLRLAGTWTYAAGANNAAATLGRGDEWSMIQRLDLVANGNDIIRTFSGTQLKMMNRWLYGSLPRTSPTLGDGATAAPTFESFLTIPLWQPLAAKPMDTALDSSKLSELRLDVQVDANTGFNSASPPTSFSTSLEITSLESFGVTGDFSACKMYPILAQSPAANAQFQVQLPVTALYRGFLIGAADGSSNSASDLPNAINQVRLKSGNYPFRDVRFSMLRDWARMRLGWARDFVQQTAALPELGNGFTYLRGGKSLRIAEDAWAFMDLVHDGYLGEGVDSVGLSELYLEFDLAAACTLTIIPIQLFPPRKSAPAPSVPGGAPVTGT